jgi:hypothetical protein
MITKTQILNSLDQLPESMTVDSLIYHSLLLEKIEKGLQDSKEGRTNTKEEAKKKLGKWLK